MFAFVKGLFRYIYTILGSRLGSSDEEGQVPAVCLDRGARPQASPAEVSPAETSPAASSAASLP